MDICEHENDRFGCHICAEAWLKNMKMGKSVWKGMSSSTKRGFSPSVPAGTDLKSSSHKNGSGPPPLKYSSAPVDDVNMNEVIDEQIELSVTLPGGKTTVIPVDSNIPMQDLRVLLAAKSKVSPTGYTLIAISEETGKPLDYKANQTIGSLDARTIQLISKQKEKEAEKAKVLKRESTSKIIQPFETTYRFTINLPRNQKMVMRISPDTNLGTVYTNVCKEKHLDPRRFTLQHPANPQSQIDMKCTVADIRSNEINLVPLGLIADSARSMPDLSRSESLTLPKESYPSYMPGASEPKKKRGFLSFLKRKDNKFKVQETKYTDFETSSTASHQMKTAPPQPTTPPTERHTPKASTDQVRPKSMFVTAKELKVHEESVSRDTTLPRPTGKKKRAPPPPQQRIPETVEISVSDKSDQAGVSAKDKKPVPASEKRVHAKDENVKSASDHVTQRLHSRNSSDSSGYHELTLSGAESPEANRVSSNFKTSIDTTSIESADNTNGDSGINEHSPVHSSPKRQDMNAGDSKTLPLPKSSKKAVQRSHSFEKKDKLKQAPVQSTKKRRAPAPPPGAVGGEAKPPPSTSPPSHSPDASQDLALVTSSPEKSHNAAVESSQLTPNDTAELKTINLHDDIDDDEDESFDINDTIDGLMMMVEDQSIASEDIDNIEHAKPPPTFIAPPPPVEPPPPQTPEAETVDVGTEVNDNASLGACSVKSSPRAAHSRTNSHSSITSVNTIEDLNLAFEQTIAMATEALENEEQENDLQLESGYKNEMAMFVEKMSHLTEKADSEVSDATSISLPDTESNSETGSVIRHEHDQKPYHLKLDSLSSDSGSVQKFEDERSREGSTDASGGLESSYDDIPDHPRLNLRRDSIELRREKSADNAVSEIDVPVDTLPPPPEFRNEADDEEEEEYRESVEEIVVTMPSSSSYTFGGAYKIPDYQTPKEHQVMPDSPRSRTTDQNLVYSTFDINGKSETKSEVVEKPKPPRVKEEFVITKEELAKIKFFDDTRVKRSLVQPAKRPTSLDTGLVTQIYQSDSTATSFQPSYSQEDSFTNSEQEDNVKSRCLELSFQPSSEGEIDNVLEEKSISMIALPAMRTSVLRKSDDEYLDNIKRHTSKETDSDQEMRKRFLDEEYSEVVQAKPVYISEGDTSATSESSELDEDEDLKKQQAALHAQYDLLQQQFTMWQQQLEQNQKLLAAQNIDPEVQSMQQMQAQQMQLQMQMQQQMMAQLQKSMDALSLQQKNRGEASANTSSASMNLSSSSLGSSNAASTQATVNPVSATVIAASSRPSGGSGINAVPAPPPPPPSEPLPTAGLKKASDRPARKNDPRFERKLDPREELMIAIRSFGERGGLKKVPIQKTHWHAGSS